MAAEEQTKESGGRKPLTPMQRKRIAQCFEHATKKMGLDEYDFDYVCDMLKQCVEGEPDNDEYRDAFLRNLHKKFKNAGKGNALTALAGVGTRGALKKAIAQKEWDTAIKKVIELLKMNPWDTAALCGMATVCGEGLGNINAELKWLWAALQSTPKDADVNRQCALALARQNQYDQAIVCWKRVQTARPNDDEPPREIGRLAIEKARSQVTGPGAEAASGERTGGGGGARDDDADTSPEERLRRQIQKDPQNVANYKELARLYLSSERYRDADKVLAGAMKISNNDPDVREQWEDARMRFLRHEVAKIEQELRDGAKGEKVVAEHKRLRVELLKVELAHYKSQVERNPNNLNLHYELGMRHRSAGQHPEAIKQFQVAMADPRLKGTCLLQMAICFTHIRQYRLAMNNFAQAIDALPDRDAAGQKDALYRAGQLALALKDADTAEKYLSRLAQMDFGYKDIATLLAKIEEVRNDKGLSGDKGPHEDQAPTENAGESDG